MSSDLITTKEWFKENFNIEVKDKQEALEEDKAYFALPSCEHCKERYAKGFKQGLVAGISAGYEKCHQEYMLYESKAEEEGYNEGFTAGEDSARQENKADHEYHEYQLRQHARKIEELAKQLEIAVKEAYANGYKQAVDDHSEWNV